jgi:hypothetical protein
VKRHVTPDSPGLAVRAPRLGAPRAKRSLRLAWRPLDGAAGGGKRAETKVSTAPHDRGRRFWAPRLGGGAPALTAAAPLHTADAADGPTRRRRPPCALTPRPRQERRRAGSCRPSQPSTKAIRPPPPPRSARAWAHAPLPRPWRSAVDVRDCPPTQAFSRQQGPRARAGGVGSRTPSVAPTAARAPRAAPPAARRPPTSPRAPPRRRHTPTGPAAPPRPHAFPALQPLSRCRKGSARGGRGPDRSGRVVRRGGWAAPRCGMDRYVPNDDDAPPHGRVLPASEQRHREPGEADGEGRSRHHDKGDRHHHKKSRHRRGRSGSPDDRGARAARRSGSGGRAPRRAPPHGDGGGGGGGGGGVNGGGGGASDLEDGEIAEEEGEVPPPGGEAAPAGGGAAGGADGAPPPLPPPPRGGSAGSPGPAAALPPPPAEPSGRGPDSDHPGRSAARLDARDASRGGSEAPRCGGGATAGEQGLPGEGRRSKGFQGRGRTQARQAARVHRRCVSAATRPPERARA